MLDRLLRVAYVICLVVGVVAGAVLAAGVLSGLHDLKGPNRLVIPLRVDRSGSAQLFFDRGAGIRAEDCSTVGVAVAKDLRAIAFELPRESMRALRFDPVVAYGEFAVGAPRLESATGRLIAQFPLTAVVPLNQIAEMRRVGDHWEGTTVQGANDPQLTLGLGEPLRVGEPKWPWASAAWVVGATALALALRKDSANRELKISRSVLSALSPSVNRARTFCEAHRSAIVAAGAVMVAVVECVRLWPLHQTLDWPMWDEANYAARGAEWAVKGGGLGDIHSSPLYVLSYAVLARAGELSTAIFAQHYFIKVTSTVLLYFLLARWWRSVLAAVAAALFWGATDFQLEFPLLVYQAGWVWFLGGLVVLDRWPVAGVLLMAAAACVRQEYQFAMAVLVVCIAWRNHQAWRTWFSTRGQTRVGVGIAVGAAALLAVVAAHTSFGGSSGRAWFAFQQHYAVRAVAEGESNVTSPWLDYPKVIDRDFKGAHSLSDAWRINRAAVVRHVSYNVRNLGTEIAGLLRIHSRLPAAWWLALVAVGALIASPLRSNHAQRFKVPFSTVGAAAGLVVIAPGLIVLAKGAYLLALVPGIIGGVGWLLRCLPRASEKARSWIGVSSVALVAVVLVSEWRGPDVFVPGERPRPIAETVSILRNVLPASNHHVLLGAGASSFAHYLGDDRFQGVEPFLSATGDSGASPTLQQWLDRVHPDAVLITEDWRGTSGFNSAEFTAALRSPEWVARPVPTGELYSRQR